MCRTPDLVIELTGFHPEMKEFGENLLIPK
jgi:hypothetical protein